MVPIPKAVRVRTSSGWQDIALVGPAGPAGGVLDARRISGQYNGYQGPNNITTAIQMYTDLSAAVPLRLSYTPPIDCWWDVGFDVGIVQKNDANYHYCYGGIQLTPGDVDGVSDCSGHLVTQHASVNQYEARQVRRLFKLAAGVPYVASAVLGPASGGSWSYYAGSAQMWMEALAYARGSAIDPANRWFSVQNVSAVSSVNFPGLDGATDLAYELYGQFRWQSVGGDNELLLRFNGDAVGSGRYVWTQAGSYFDNASVGTSNGTNTSPGISILRSNWNNDGYCTIRGIISVPAPAINVIEYMGQGLFRADQAGPYIGARQHSGQYYAAGANLTSLAVVAPAGNLTGRFALRKLF
jgi:hypothetical protein